jgi:hypothetical protein
MYDFEERLYSDAFMDGIVYAAKYFAENEGDKKKEEKENIIKSIWAGGFGKEETRKARKELLDEFDKRYEAARKDKKKMREALVDAYAGKNGIELNRARLARLGGRAGLIGGAAGIAGGAGYGAYKLSQD